MDRINYNQKFKDTLGGLYGRPRLLLHVCCAPCLAGVIGRVESHFDVTLLYYNPNIRPRREYLRRLGEIKKYLSASGRDITLIEGGYDQADYEAETGVYTRGEGGARCGACCAFRAAAAAKCAADGGYDYFCTTLTVSPHKNADEINKAMERAAERYGVKHLPSDFKKENGFLNAAKECAKYGIYRQDYCGCSPSKLTVLVTGGIASGKSEFVRILGVLGAYTISADEVSRRLTAEGGELNGAIKRAFPSAVKAGELDRTALRAIVFADAAARKQLNEITHRAVYDEIMRGIAAAPPGIVAVEIPLLFESGFDRGGDVTVNISSPLPVRRERAALRDGIGEALFDSIAASQMTDEERERLADITVRNDGGIETLEAKAKELHASWKSTVKTS